MWVNRFFYVVMFSLLGVTVCGASLELCPAEAEKALMLSPFCESALSGHSVDSNQKPHNPYHALSLEQFIHRKKVVQGSLYPVACRWLYPLDQQHHDWHVKFDAEGNVVLSDPQELKTVARYKAITANGIIQVRTEQEVKKLGNYVEYSSAKNNNDQPIVAWRENYTNKRTHVTTPYLAIGQPLYTPQESATLIAYNKHAACCVIL